MDKILTEFWMKDNKFNFGKEQSSPDSSNKYSLNDMYPTTSDRKLRKSRQKQEYDVPEIAQEGFRKYVSDIEKRLTEDLKVAPYKKLDIMVRDSATFRMTTEFERIYRIIFGSQMRLLRHLESEKTMSKEEVDKFFRHEKRKQNNKYLELNSWKDFMVGQGLIGYKDNVYQITDKGIAFLTYMAVSSYEDRTW